MTINCAHCGEPFRPARSDAVFCSGRCRVAAFRDAQRRGQRGATRPAGPQAAPEAVPVPAAKAKPATGAHTGSAVVSAPGGKPKLVPGKKILPRRAPPIQAVPPNKRKLTRQQVDPEFIGDDLAFIGEYGHVWLETAEERATTRFGIWAMALRHLAKEWSRPDLLPQKLDINWLRSPKPEDVAKLRAAVETLKPALAIAEAALAKAEAELAKKGKPKPKG